MIPRREEIAQLSPQLTARSHAAHGGAERWGSRRGYAAERAAPGCRPSNLTRFIPAGGSAMSKTIRNSKRPRETSSPPRCGACRSRNGVTPEFIRAECAPGGCDPGHRVTSTAGGGPRPPVADPARTGQETVGHLVPTERRYWVNQTVAQRRRVIDDPHALRDPGPRSGLDRPVSDA